MVMDQIEDLKRQYTDKYVLVDAQRPELARFRDVVGRVKTVNMSGRALVEFDNYHLNIGWYDIDPQFLKVVDKPPPKPKEAPAKEPAAKKPAGEAASAAGAKAAAKPQAKPAGGKPSVADILAAARGGAAKTGASPAAKPAAPKSEGATPAKVDRSKMSVADMIAAAKGGGAKSAAPVAEAKTQAAPEPAEEETVEGAPTGEPASAGGESAPAPAKQPSGEKIDKKSMSIADMIAWCTAHDAK
jgi:hypothetical protein